MKDFWDIFFCLNLAAQTYGATCFGAFLCGKKGESLINYEKLIDYEA